MRKAGLTAATIGHLPLFPLSACSSSSSAPAGSAYGAAANAKGDTLCWYSKDVKGSGGSACTDTCLSAWPAVTGKPAASGIKLNGALETITRPGGTVQVTYNGYPLYTYTEDTGPGATEGNGADGVWHVITGSVLTSSKPAGTSGSGNMGGSSGSGGSYGSGSSGR